MRKQKQNQKLKDFIEKLKANGANFNEAYLEVSEHIPDEQLDLTLKILNEIYTSEEERAARS